MAKGLAVISGSNTVMFKALETGIITAGTISGSTLKPATFTLTGSLLLSGASEPVLQLQGLTLTPTSSVANDTILIKNGDFVRQATVLSGNQVVLQGGQNVEQRINTIEASLGASSLTVSSSVSSVQVDLDTEALKFVGTSNEVEVSITETSPNVQVQIGLPNAVTITDSLTITGGAGDKLVITQGNLDVQNGAISGSSNLDIGGKIVAAGEITGSSNLKIVGSADIGTNLTVGGNLTVNGAVTVIDTTNLRIEDPIIILGSGSTATDGDKGFIFQRASADNRAFLWDDNTDKFVLGATNNDGTSTDLTLAYDTAAKSTLVLHTLSASNLEATGDVTLGNAGTDRLTINSYITGSGSPIVVSSSLTIGDATNTSNETLTLVSPTRMPIFSVSGTYAVSGYPAVPADFNTNATNYSGYNFYLTSSNTGSGGVPGDLGDGTWLQGNKWYFNERGVWHASFFYSGVQYLKGNIYRKAGEILPFLLLEAGFF